MNVFIPIFVVTFIWMEFMAWFLHKYVMHGFLWVLHEDHHDPHNKKLLHNNDAFAFFFAVPSFFSILFGSLYQNTELSAFGYGIMAYGAVYFCVHEVIIHRRLRWFKSSTFYTNGLVAAHKEHHTVNTKEGTTNFGMLAVHPKYILRAWKHRHLRTRAATIENQAPNLIH